MTVRQFSVVFDANAALVEVFLTCERFGHEGSGLMDVNGTEEHSLGIDDEVVSEVTDTTIIRHTRIALR